MEDDRPGSLPSELRLPASRAAAASPTQKMLAWLERFRKPVASVAALGAIVSGFAGYWTTYRVVNTSLETGSAASSKKLPANSGPLSIVVLPFTNVTGDASQDYVADGLTDSITSDLSRIDSAFVVGATTAQAYKSKTLTAQQVGAELGVRFVLRGTVQRSANKLRINAQLIDASNNAQLWSEMFEGETTDLFALQDRVTTLIGNSMGQEMVKRAAKFVEASKGDATVADLILRIRAKALAPQSLANLQVIEAFARRALAIEPANVEAQLKLASALAVQVDNFGGDMAAITRTEALGESSALVEQVASLQPDNPRVYHLRGIIAFDRNDVLQALRNGQRFI